MYSSVRYVGHSPGDGDVIAGFLYFTLVRRKKWCVCGICNRSAAELRLLLLYDASGYCHIAAGGFGMQEYVDFSWD